MRLLRSLEQAIRDHACAATHPHAEANLRAQIVACFEDIERTAFTDGWLAARESAALRTYPDERIRIEDALSKRASG